MAKYLKSFDELIVELQKLKEPLDGARQLVVLLSNVVKTTSLRGVDP